MMIAGLARSVGASALACLMGIALLMLTFHALSRDWDLHSTLDLGGTLLVLATATTAVTCLPIFALRRGSATRGRAALVGAASAALTGVVAVGWFFADGFYPVGVGDWLRVLATPLFVPFPIAGAAFGYAWSSHRYQK